MLRVGQNPEKSRISEDMKDYFIRNLKIFVQNCKLFLMKFVIFFSQTIKNQTKLFKSSYLEQNSNTEENSNIIFSVSPAMVKINPLIFF